MENVNKREMEVFLLATSNAMRERQRKERRERQRDLELLKIIRIEAISRSQTIGEKDRTVWEAYNNLKTEFEERWPLNV